MENLTIINSCINIKPKIINQKNNKNIKNWFGQFEKIKTYTYYTTLTSHLNYFEIF